MHKHRAMIPDMRLWMVKRGMVKDYQRGEKDAEEETEETSDFKRNHG